MDDIDVQYSRMRDTLITLWEMEDTALMGPVEFSHWVIDTLRPLFQGETSFLVSRL